MPNTASPTPPAEQPVDTDGEAFRNAARLGLTLRFYGSCAQSSMPGTPSAYVVTQGGDRAEAMREAVEQAAAIIANGGEAPKAPLAPPAEQQDRWVERWHGSGGKEFWEGWSILNAANREMIAHLGPDVDPDAVRGIVAAHNEALCGECAGTGGRWCPACAGATPTAEQQACDTQLFKFYGVSTTAELIAAQARHIEKLQAKLPPTPSFAPQRVREG